MIMMPLSIQGEDPTLKTHPKQNVFPIESAGNSDTIRIGIYRRDLCLMIYYTKGVIADI